VKQNKPLLAIGFALVAALLAMVSLPRSASVQAREESGKAEPCRMVEFAVDQGYGVSLTEQREVCRTADSAPQ